MKIIEFRGKDIDTNEYVYGSYVLTYDGPIIVENWGMGGSYHVDFNTVEQLIGFDVNGTKIFDKDKIGVLDQDNQTYIAGEYFTVHEVGHKHSNVCLVEEYKPEKIQTRRRSKCESNC